MRTNKLKKFETVKTSLIVADTDEERQCLIAELLLIAERMPVEKIIDAAPTKHNSGDAEILDKKNLTDIKSGDAEILDEKKLTDIDTGTFSKSQLLILEQIQNA
jgi:hypothetical protein